MYAMKTFYALVLINVLRSTASSDIYPFRNVTLPWDVRVDDLVRRLTLQELIDQMSYGGGGPDRPVPAITRLGIGPYQFDTECLHGIMSQFTTTFPQSIGIAASFSEELTYIVAEAIGTEARAVYNNASKHGDYSIMKGMSCFAPFNNPVRHPLWGRIQEVYGEDPYLGGVLASAYVRGMQGPHSRYMRATSGCKVVGVYSGPENIPESRFTFNAVVSERDLRLTYFPQFKACIDAGTMNLMCSYYSMNGIPGCTHNWLLQDVMRSEYGFKGYYVTDWGALRSAVDEKKYYKNYLESAVAGANAGVNLELPDDPPVFLHLIEAVDHGMVKEERLRELVKPLFYTRMRLGEFDPPDNNPYVNITTDRIQSPIHREIAIQAAIKSYVLLKNDDSILPLKGTIKNLAVIGPMSDNLTEISGSYSPVMMPQFAKTPLQGFQSLADTISYASGCNNPGCSVYNSTAVKLASQSADVIIVSLGTGSTFEGEGGDRSTMDLPGYQRQLLMDVMALAKQPIVLLLFSGGPLNISDVRSSSKIGAIIQCFFPAQATGESLRRVLAVSSSGEITSPAARMPYTWPKTIEQIPSMTNYSMEGRTYRYFHGPGAPLYPFGYGLSYFNFEYSNLRIIPLVVKPKTDLTVTVDVRNLGPTAGVSDEVVQVYISWRDSPVPMPLIQLIAVRRSADIKTGETRTVVFTINSEQLRVWDDTQGFIYHSGLIDVFVGGQQPNQETKASSNVLQGQITVASNDVWQRNPTPMRNVGFKEGHQVVFKQRQSWINLLKAYHVVL